MLSARGSEKLALILSLREQIAALEMQLDAILGGDGELVPIQDTGKTGRVVKVAKPAKVKGGKRGGGRSTALETVNDIIRLGREGLTKAEIVERTGSSPSTVYRVLGDNGITTPRSNKKKVVRAGAKEKGNAAWEALDGPGQTSKSKKLDVTMFSRVKIALSHTVPHELIAKEMRTTLEEVKKIELAKVYADYLQS